MFQSQACIGLLHLMEYSFPSLQFVSKIFIFSGDMKPYHHDGYGLVSITLELQTLLA